MSDVCDAFGDYFLECLAHARLEGDWSEVFGVERVAAAWFRYGEVFGCFPGRWEGPVVLEVREQLWEEVQGSPLDGCPVSTIGWVQ